MKEDSEYYDYGPLAAMLEEEWKVTRYSKVEVWCERFSTGVTEQYKISICTTSMNRLKDIKQTLLKNIADNMGYPNLEFVLLDYNSTDGLGAWVRTHCKKYLESGLLVFYRTEEPEFYDMSHARNVAFKLATGDIVNNVDADSFTNKGFAEYVNRMANQQPSKAMFAKSRQLLRGRLGFFKKEFISIRGGYDENLKNYGHDDQDLMNRAWELGFTMMPFRGTYYGCTPDHVKKQEGNYEDRAWYTEKRNRFESYANILLGKFKANEGRKWGKAKVVKNFEKEIEV